MCLFTIIKILVVICKNEICKVCIFSCNYAKQIEKVTAHSVIVTNIIKFTRALVKFNKYLLVPTQIIVYFAKVPLEIMSLEFFLKTEF